MFEQLDSAILTHAEWVFEQLINTQDDTDRAYYQGQIDGLAQVRRQIARLEKVGA